eukprot:CAMPEP_0175158542 /NCGR_PEP_ID=MMETSP0087-20121206/22874_1 /TAXON_ID=136419 /ORGANISM="Unknown Unknown, Strain D1" /LENGTH=73 /DNA_ID=CAMNT_0016446391 /DNA_START=49 /DNA_END=267 /DNA_ORIENTATION=+
MCGTLSHLDHTTAPVLRYLFKKSVEPFLLILHNWVYRGILQDPYEEFFVERVPVSTNANNSNNSTTTATSSSS